MSRIMDAERVAVLGLHWQVNAIRREGFFGRMLAESVERGGVVDRAARFHEFAAAAGVALVFARFTVPEGEGALVRNTDFMCRTPIPRTVSRQNRPGHSWSPKLPRRVGRAFGAKSACTTGIGSSS
jgi:hypothetical protein